MIVLEDSNHQDGATGLVLRLRTNRAGTIALPYHIDWKAQTWLELFTDAYNPLELRLRDFGLLVGNRLGDCWMKLQAYQAQFSVFNALIDYANFTAYDLLRRGIDRINAAATDPYGLINTPEDLLHNASSDWLSDALGTLFKQFCKAGIMPLSSALRPTLEIAPETMSCLLVQVTLLQALTFAFDRVLFLGAEVTFSDNKARLAANTSLEGREFLLRRALTTALDEDEFVGTHLRSQEQTAMLWWPPYRLVKRIRWRANEIEVGVASLKDTAEKSRFGLLRHRVGSEYLFETLFKESRGKVEIPSEQSLATESSALHAAYAWDVLHSLVTMIFEGVPGPWTNLFSYFWSFDDLVSVISESLEIGREHAAAALQLLTLGGRARDGIWSRPLIEVAAGKYKLNMAAISAIKPERFLQLLISNCELDKLRGDIFQGKVRLLIERFSGPGTITNFTILPANHRLHSLPKSPQVDGVLLEGNCVVVCEIKSYSHIADPREYFFGRSSIETAERQIQLRIKYMEQNKELVRRTLGLSDDPIFHGLIITNGRFFEGSSDYSYPILDSRDLVRFLQNETLVSGLHSYTEFPEKLRQQTYILRKPGMTHLESLMLFAKHNPDFEFQRDLFELVDERFEIDGFALSFERGQRGTKGAFSA